MFRRGNELWMATMENSFSVIERECGGWLAVSAPTNDVRIGVVGATEQEAASRFEATMGIWTSLLAPKRQGDDDGHQES
jgi:hypothetical protein